MSISVPDSSLLLDSIDKSLATILQGNSSMNFRMHSVRMQLQLDTMPVHSSVEEYARTVLAELELLAVAAPENTAKKQRVASMTADPLKGKGSGKPSTGNGKTNEVAGTPSGTPSKGNGPPKKACTAWITDKGCKYGKLCTFSHAADRAGKCWFCGGSHQKVDCVAPGGGKHQKSSGDENPGKAKAKGANSDNSGNTGKGKPGGAKAPAKTGDGLTQEAIKEAAALLQSLRVASLRPYVKSMTDLLCRAQQGQPRALLMGVLQLVCGWPGRTKLTYLE